MSIVKLTRDSKPIDFHCTCGCEQGELDEAFMRQLLSFLAISGQSDFDISSGYRCSMHNAAVYGKPDSRHLTGQAVDILCDSVQAKEIVIDAAHRAGLKGMGFGETFIHLDNREIPAQWTYPKKN